MKTETLPEEKAASLGSVLLFYSFALSFHHTHGRGDHATQVRQVAWQDEGIAFLRQIGEGIDIFFRHLQIDRFDATG